MAGLNVQAAQGGRHGAEAAGEEQQTSRSWMSELAHEVETLDSLAGDGLNREVR
jgi:hypothetical protein